MQKVILIKFNVFNVLLAAATVQERKAISVGSLMNLIVRHFKRERMNLVLCNTFLFKIVGGLIPVVDPPHYLTKLEN
jgi:hypothetical protein